MCYRVQAGATTQNDINWKQRVAKEESRIDRPPGAMPDPFAHSLSTILSQTTLSAPGRAQPQLKGAGATTGGGSRPASQLSAGGRSRASAAGSRAHGRSAMGSAMGSAAPAAPPRRAASQLSVASTGISGISGRTPSSICTADPSCIARNKIAELELRLELERVVRLERENELEDQRRRTLVAEGKLQEKADADAKPKAAAGGANMKSAPGRADQLAMVG